MKDQPIYFCMFSWVSYHGYSGNFYFTSSKTQDSRFFLPFAQSFAQAGTVSSVALIKDRDTGRSKGFAFVEMSTQAEAEGAIKQFHGQRVGDRELTVNMARPREERPRDGGFGGGGGGGRNDGGGGGGGFGGPRRDGPGGGNRTDRGGGTQRY